MTGLPRHPDSRPPFRPRRGTALLALTAATATGLVLLSDQLLARLYATWRPRLEQQVGRVMGRPLQLGPYQGFGPDGLRVLSLIHI